MINEFKAAAIEKMFRFDYNYLDFFYPYTEAKGYEDVESEATDDEYDALETQFFEDLPKKEIIDLKCRIERRIDEEIRGLMSLTVKKKEEEK